MRGKALKLSGIVAGVGITPAYAGKRANGRDRQAFSRDHPRVCGEKRIVVKNSLNCWGSPPRMRGKGAEDAAEDTAPGITPAYAGKSGLSSQKMAAQQDHPHVCGEKREARLPGTDWPGSPPRMRGKDCIECVEEAPTGIIPAYAGKSTQTFRHSGRGGDHPRVCGEKGKRQRQTSLFTGSPPRMRGKGPLVGLASRHTGITPAYAGKSERG